MLLWLGEGIVIILIGFGRVAFITLLERKTLGLTQNRLGPTKTRLSGVLQPVADGVKLLVKFYQNLRTSAVLLLGPRLVLIIFILCWVLIPWIGKYSQSVNSGLTFIILLRITSYSVIIRSWSTTSSFAKLGISRRILQRVAYEVTLVSIILFVFCINTTPSLTNNTLILRAFLFFLWRVLLIIDCNRAPFDLIEGERELIRGFNTEIRRLSFVFLFLGEYGIILVFSFFITLVCNVTLILTIIFIMVVLIRRSSFPRLRYDSLIRFSWKVLTPLVLLLILISCCLL